MIQSSFLATLAQAAGDLNPNLRRGVLHTPSWMPVVTGITDKERGLFDSR
jgi:hypothetical protein